MSDKGFPAHVSRLWVMFGAPQFRQARPVWSCGVDSPIPLLSWTTNGGRKGILRASVWGFGLLMFVLGCSSPEPVQPRTTGEDVSSEATDSGAGRDPDGGASDDTVAPSQPSAVPSVTPAEASVVSLSDDDLAGVVELAMGQRAEDEFGNIVSVYGIAELPESVQRLGPGSWDALELVPALESSLVQPGLVALDIGMCRVGIEGEARGDLDFSVAASGEEPLTAGSPVEAPYPVISPGFEFPAPAECARGWLPLARAPEDEAGFARYLVTSNVGDEVERHLFQWTLGAESDDAAGVSDSIQGADAAPADVAAAAGDRFDVGQTVSFNAGPLAETSMTVDGWAELVGYTSPIEDTRMVGVSLELCLSSGPMPEFGLGIDGWNLIAADAESAIFGSESVSDQATGCLQGWLEFAVPNGAVPSSFFASDGRSADHGYAEWSLDQAAIPAPE